VSGRTPRMAVVLGEARRPCQVEAPDRVLRMWMLLNLAAEEFHQAAQQPGAAARLQRQLDAVTAELERSVSPALAGEMRRLLGAGRPGTPTTAELRVRYASLLGWTSGLVIGMLNQLEKAAQTGRSATSGS
jgi:hypothetical protein